MLFYVIRAIETGRPIARAANTGVSALIHATGKIEQATDIFSEEVVYVDIPRLSGRTLYTFLPQDLFAWLVLLVIVLMSVHL